jgi:hypothetical protein
MNWDALVLTGLGNIVFDVYLAVADDPELDGVGGQEDMVDLSAI